MRYFTEDILDEIKRELSFIFAAHKVCRLDGKMRLFSVANQDHWKSHESGFEFWFGADQIEAAINKIRLFYRGGNLPNTAFLLDPVLYDKQEGERHPKPIGSGIIWGTVLCQNGESVPDDAIERIKDLGIFCTPLNYRDSKNAGLKMFGFLSKPVMPVDEHVPQDGSLVPGIQSLLDLANINSNATYGKHYLLSGLEYRVSHGSYQHPRFMDVFGKIPPASTNHIRKAAVHIEKIRDSGICWNAYDRNPVLYERYGIDVANLSRNLKAKIDTDRGIDEIKRELAVIWAANTMHGLKGEMRLYTAPSQDKWRAKMVGYEFWFGPNEIDKAADELKLQYNGGLMPNSPLLLDPVVYKKNSDGEHIPVGTGVVWASAFALGNTQFNIDEAVKRLKDTGVHCSVVKRGGRPGGIKMIGFLEKPVMIDWEAIVAARKAEEEAAKTAEDEEVLEIEEKVKAAQEKDAAIKKAEENVLAEGAEFEGMEKGDKEGFWGEGRDVFEIEGCRELFNIVNNNGEPYYPYYFLSGIEYLTAHGSFESESMYDMVNLDEIQSEEDIKKLAVSLQRIKDADKCWNEYDRYHSLWERFGIDTKNLERNLFYFNLCARDFSFLDLTGGDRKDLDEKFEFFAPGWVPKQAITMIGATGGTGKSSIAHRLAIMAATDWREDEEPLWLGSPINKKFAKGLVIYFSGEDGAAIINARAKLIDPEMRAKRLMFVRVDFGMNDKGMEANLSDYFKKLHKLPDVSLVVLDPVRKYLTGDEDDSDIVSQFFEAVEEFTISKKCAFVCVHHLVKGAAPKDSRQIIDLLRGSQVFIDRPRVVLGMYRDGPYTVVGLAKNNIPPGLGMVEGERIFVREPKQLDLLWLPGPDGVRSFTVSEEELEQIKLEAEAKAQLAATEKAAKEEAAAKEKK